MASYNLYFWNKNDKAENSISINDLNSVETQIKISKNRKQKLKAKIEILLSSHTVYFLNEVFYLFFKKHYTYMYVSIFL